MAEKNEPKFELRSFDGTVDKAEEFYRNFKLCAEKFKWTEIAAQGDATPPAYFHMAVRLTSMASVWWDSLEIEKKNTYAKMCTEFENKWIQGESFLLLNEKFEGLKLGDKDLDEFHMELVHLGKKLKASEDTIASRFLNSLPLQMKTFALTSDDHSVTAYIKKCRLYKATQKSAQPLVNTIQPNCEQIEEGHDFYYGEGSDVNAVGYRPIQRPYNHRGRGQYYRGSRNYRGARGSQQQNRGSWQQNRGSWQQNRGSWQQNRGASNTHPRGASQHNGANRGQGNRGRGNIRGVCHACKQPGHFIRDCKFDPKKGLNSCSRCHLPTHSSQNCPF